MRFNIPVIIEQVSEFNLFTTTYIHVPWFVILSQNKVKSDKVHDICQLCTYNIYIYRLNVLSTSTD